MFVGSNQHCSVTLHMQAVNSAIARSTLISSVFPGVGRRGYILSEHRDP